MEAILREWRSRVYPCQAATCKERGVWHMRRGVDPDLVARTDRVLEEAS